ncbi:MAG: SDR family NAD(P)-dependent oxidoreductase [Chlamydiae bacterium]|nr:SDR family NAD(P)-dependent oxidoreductase [Chlamydiota bacterium]
MVALALITGASSGLGTALAKRLAQDKVPLFLTGRNKDALEKLQNELSLQTEVNIFAADLSLPKERSALLAEISQRKPDLVINSAGFGLYGGALTHPLTEQLKILEVNALALTEITLESARALIEEKKPGVIMNISSAAGFLPTPSFAIYSASKAYVTHFSQSFDAEVKKEGIRILVSCPGQIKTSFRERASSGLNKNQEGFEAMSVEKAAKLILKQIHHKKPMEIIDFRYKVLVFIARFLLPKSLVQKKMQTKLEKRIRSKIY